MVSLASDNCFIFAPVTKKQNAMCVRGIATSKYINLYTDFAFKKIFGTEANKDILISFLNTFLEFEGDKAIEDIEYINPEQLGDTNRFRFPNFLNSGVDYIFTIGSNSTAYPGYYSITTYANYEPYEGTEAKGAYLFDDATQSYPTWTVADGTIEVADICILENYGTTNGYSCISLEKKGGYVYLYWTDYTDGSTEYYNAV